MNATWRIPVATRHYKIEIICHQSCNEMKALLAERYEKTIMKRARNTEKDIAKTKSHDSHCGTSQPDSSCDETGNKF